MFNGFMGMEKDNATCHSTNSQTYHELFHWHNSRRMKHLDLNSTPPVGEFLEQRKTY